MTPLSKLLAESGASPDLVIGLYGLPRASSSAVSSLQDLIPSGCQFRLFVHSWFRTTAQPLSWHKIADPTGSTWVNPASLYTTAFPAQFASMTIDRQFDYGGGTLSEYSNKLNLIYSISKVASEISRYCDEFGWKPKGLIITRQDIIFMPKAVQHDMFLDDAICHGGHFSVAKGGQLNAEDLIFVTDYRNISYFKSFYGWAREKIMSAHYNYSIQFFNECGLRTIYREELKYGSQMIIDRSYATPP